MNEIKAPVDGALNPSIVSLQHAIKALNEANTIDDAYKSTSVTLDAFKDLVDEIQGLVNNWSFALDEGSTSLMRAIQLLNKADRTAAKDVRDVKS